MFIGTFNTQEENRVLPVMLSMASAMAQWTHLCFCEVGSTRKKILVWIAWRDLPTLQGAYLLPSGSKQKRGEIIAQTRDPQREQKQFPFLLIKSFSRLLLHPPHWMLHDAWRVPLLSSPHLSFLTHSPLLWLSSGIWKVITVLIPARIYSIGTPTLTTLPVSNLPAARGTSIAVFSCTLPALANPCQGRADRSMGMKYSTYFQKNTWLVGPKKRWYRSTYTSGIKLYELQALPLKGQNLFFPSYSNNLIFALTLLFWLLFQDSHLQENLLLAGFSFAHWHQSFTEESGRRGTKRWQTCTTETP